ncbi:hypothetical protein D3C83_299710 [compost metagenome]
MLEDADLSRDLRAHAAGCQVAGDVAGEADARIGDVLGLRKDERADRLDFLDR